MMIMAVMLSRNALKTAVNTERKTNRRNGSPRDAFSILTLTYVNTPLRAAISTKTVAPMTMPITSHSIISM